MNLAAWIAAAIRCRIQTRSTTICEMGLIDER